MEKGFFYGYNGWTVMIILLQAGGGLIVSLVVKWVSFSFGSSFYAHRHNQYSQNHPPHNRYADNILKGFATSLSIILSSIASIYLFQYEIRALFVIGAAMVLYGTMPLYYFYYYRSLKNTAIYLYSKPSHPSGYQTLPLTKSSIT